jgi:hypothetical protein
MNLLDFGDDDSAEPAAAASPDPMALLDQLSVPEAPPRAAAGATDNDDWEDFASTEPAVQANVATGGASTTEWEPFTGDAQQRKVDKGDDWADFTSAPGVGTAAGGFEDPFSVSVGQTAGKPAPFGSVGAVPSTGLRQALPLDAFAAPAIDPIPVASATTLGPSAEARVPSQVPAAVKAAPEKDPFADLLGWSDLIWYISCCSLDICIVWAAAELIAILHAAHCDSRWLDVGSFSQWLDACGNVRVNWECVLLWLL